LIKRRIEPIKARAVNGMIQGEWNGSILAAASGGETSVSETFTCPRDAAGKQPVEMGGEAGLWNGRKGAGPMVRISDGGMPERLVWNGG
jgi:hypothetical protein